MGVLLLLAFEEAAFSTTTVHSAIPPAFLVLWSTRPRTTHKHVGGITQRLFHLGHDRSYICDRDLNLSHPHGKVGIRYPQAQKG